MPELAQSSAAELIKLLGTSLDTYQYEGGVWLPHIPVIVNEDFNFSTAMSLEDGLGPGLAAAQRKQANATKARLLADVNFDAALTMELDRLRTMGLNVFFLLWGPETKMELTLVVDLFESGKPGVAASVQVPGGTRPLGGDDGWATASTLSSISARLVAGLSHASMKRHEQNCGI